MQLLIYSFFISLSVTLILIRSQHLHQNLSGDSNLSAPQKIHTYSVPRIGGLAIFIAISISGFFFYETNNKPKEIALIPLIICSLPTFIIGLTEDLTKKIGVKTRLILTASSALLFCYLLNASITKINIIGIDWLLNIGVISIVISIIAITGLANAFNIIDGFNGLASMVGIISTAAIGYVAFKVNDPSITTSCLILMGAIAGFFVWNYPRGLIFLGDGGAYLIGFMVATLSILLVERNSSVSPWFCLLVNIYPIFETLFTIWRRKIYQGKSPGLPDGVHFHSLVYKRIIKWATVNKKACSHTKNAKTSPYLWVLSSLAVFPSVIWWQSTLILQLFVLLFCITYILMYRAFVKFKTPKMLKFWQ